MNKILLIGNVGREPVVRYYEADQAVAQVTLATTERGYTLPNGMQVPDHTDWHNLVFYRGLAKIVEKCVHKGDKLYVEGKVRYRIYDDKMGKKHNITEVFVDNMEMLTPRSVSGQKNTCEKTENNQSNVSHGADAMNGASNDDIPF